MVFRGAFEIIVECGVVGLLFQQPLAEESEILRIATEDVCPLQMAFGQLELPDPGEEGACFLVGQTDEQNLRQILNGEEVRFLPAGEHNLTGGGVMLGHGGGHAAEPGLQLRLARVMQIVEHQQSA